VKYKEDDWYRISELLHTLLASSLGGILCSMFCKLMVGYFIFGGLIVLSMVLMLLCQLELKSEVMMSKYFKCIDCGRDCFFISKFRELPDLTCVEDWQFKGDWQEITKEEFEEAIR